MTSARMVVDKASIREGRLGPATGDIWILFGSQPFPMHNWNDFVVVILEAWVAGLVRMLRGFSATERLYFMEGPYAVDLSLPSEAVLRLRGIERRTREVERVSADTPIIEFVEGLLESAREILTECRARGHRSLDVDRLHNAVLDLTTEITRVRYTV